MRLSDQQIRLLGRLITERGCFCSADFGDDHSTRADCIECLASAALAELQAYRATERLSDAVAKLLGGEAP